MRTKHANEISLGTFKDRPAVGRQMVKTPKRVRQLIELMMWGDPDADLPPMNVKDAARHMGIVERTARNYLRHPGGRAFYLAELKALREGERAQNLHTAISIRDSADREPSAAQDKVRLEAVRFLEGDEDMQRAGQSGSVSVPGIVVHIGGARAPDLVDDTLILINPTGEPAT